MTSRVSPSSLVNVTQRSVEEILRARTPARERGLRVHAWFEQVEWIEDFALDDAALLELGLWVLAAASAYTVVFRILKVRRQAVELDRGAAVPPAVPE